MSTVIGLKLSCKSLLERGPSRSPLSLNIVIKLPRLDNETKGGEAAVLANDAVHPDEHLFLSQLQQGPSLAIVVGVVRRNVLLRIVHEMDA